MKQIVSDKYQGYTVLVIAIAAMLIPLILIETEVLQYTHGVFAYPLDDPYIHLAVAKNLALYNVWGISPHEFSSASSSIIYPLVLAGIFEIFGVHIIIPFLVNIVVAIIFLVVVQKWLVKQEVNPLAQGIILISTIYFIPLPLLVMCGMEHTLHMLFVFLFLSSLGDVFAKDPDNDVLPSKVYVYGCLITATRFESMSILLIVCAMLFLHKRWKSAFQLGVVGMLPIIVFGIFSMAKGSDFLPNSVLIKSGVPSLTVEGLKNYFFDEFSRRFFKQEAGYNELATQRLLLILPLTYLLFLSPLRQKAPYRNILILLITIATFHLCFMVYSGWPRYEAYLVGCVSVFCGVLFAKYGKALMGKWSPITTLVAGLMAAIVLGPLFLRSWKSFERASVSAVSIHDQQFEMGSFVHRYYDNEPIAFNDIGAISYLSRGRNLDLWGLGNVDVARGRRGHYDSPEFLDKLCRKDSVKIAILFEAPFRGLVGRWKKIASWDIPYNKSSFSDSVSFYAVDPIEASRLAANLKDYQSQLPDAVIVRYY